MSRNIGDTTCCFCHGKVMMVEAPRKATSRENNPDGDIPTNYYSNYTTLTCARAECVDCRAKYLAWVNLPSSFGHLRNEDDRPFVDLSFRAAFNDEPDAADMPEEVVVREWVITERKPWPMCLGGCGSKALSPDPKPGDYCRACWQKKEEDK